MAKSVFSLLCLVFLIFGALVPNKLFANSETSDWLKGSPEITDQFDIGGASIPYSINGNRDCVKQKVVTKPSKVLPYWPYLQNEESHDSCVVSTGYGTVSQSGYLKIAGEGTFGRVIYPWGGSMTLLPIPRSAHGIYIEPSYPNGVSLHLIRDLLANIESTTQASGEIVYKVKSGTSVTGLRDSKGQLLGVQLDSVSFSPGGKWMVADIPYLGLSRIDVASLSVKTFDTAFNYTVGVTPGVQSAITNKGNYVAVSSPSFTRFRLYDLNDCPTSSSCKYLDLYKYLKDSVPGFVSGVRLRFSHDYALRMYMVQKNGNSNKVIRQTVRADGHEAVGFGYLGLGDSFSSGEGAYQYKTNTDTSNNKCHVSYRSYPYLIADELGINEADSVACSGAVMNDILNMTEAYEGQVKDGVRREDRDDKPILSNFVPGFIAQIEFINEIAPETITISTVGNDIGFADKIKACLMPGTCYTSYEDRFEVANEINNQFGRLTDMYKQIKDGMDGNKVYALGYPEIVMDGGSCGGNVRLDAEEVKFANQLVRHLNKMIKAAAENTGVFYVDVEKAFYGHRLCEASYPQEALNGLTAGDDIVDLPFTDFGGPIGNESFHPNDLGHRKFKDTVLEKTNNFTAPMPASNPNAQPPQITDSMELLKDRHKTGRIIKIVHYAQDMTLDTVVLPGKIVAGGVKAAKSTFKPQSDVEAWIYSDPVKLGNFTTDEFGDINFEAILPPYLPYGFHTIHLFGLSVTGKPVDVQKVVYVADPSKISRDEDPVQGSNDTPKPPENNPETVAGHEQITQNTEPIDNTQQANRVSVVSTPTTEQALSNMKPNVAGTSTSDTSPQPKIVNSSIGKAAPIPAEPSPNKKRYFFLIPLAILPLLFIIHFIRKYA